jgi:hypothetical protein
VSYQTLEHFETDAIAASLESGVICPLSFIVLIALYRIAPAAGAGILLRILIQIIVRALIYSLSLKTDSAYIYQAIVPTSILVWTGIRMSPKDERKLDAV